MNKPRPHYLFLTGRLAEPMVHHTVRQVAEQAEFDYTIQTLPITVAALMTSKWLLRHIEVPEQVTAVIVPGYLQNDIESIAEAIQREVRAGPRDIRDLPNYFGQSQGSDYGAHGIEILAEINHANRLAIKELAETAGLLVEDGADCIDLGCTPGEPWSDIAAAVRELKQMGLKVSVDSFDAQEVTQATAAGADLVLSVNSQNWQAATEWGCEVVVIPDTPQEVSSLYRTIDDLGRKGVRMRLDPILEPLGCGFAASLQRYMECRRRYPDAAMMMGIGNITELTDADSAGINVILLGICQELKIQSVLTTQVINWARTSVQECDLARRLVHYACKHRIPPKHLEPQLLTLRDERVLALDSSAITALAKAIRDKNLRILNSDGNIHLLAAGFHASGSDPYELMEQLLDSSLGESISVSHAFYLGFELAKAMTANTLSKQYQQDQPLDWGYLTQAESFRRLDRKR